MTWWIFALLSSVTAALDIGLNRYFKADGVRLAFWVSAVQSLLFAPVLVFAPETNAFFLLAALIGGISLSIFDIRIFNVSSKFGGAVIPRILALRIWLIFFLWAAIYHDHTREMLSDPAYGLGVLGALTLGSASLFFLNRCAFSKAALIAMLPALAAAVVQAIFLKMALETVGASPVYALWYAFITSVVELAVCLGWLLYRKRSRAEIVNREYLIPGLVIGLTSTGTVGLRFIAFIGVPNPSYIYMIALLSSVWLYAAHKALKIPDARNPWAGFGLVMSAALLIWLKA